MLLLGHRGAVHATAPENTLAAVDRALRHGADGVEVDVRLTADGVPVCHHDPGMRRTAGDARHLAAMASGELPTVAGHPVPLLSEILDLVGDRGRLVVELKTPHGPAGAATGTVEAVASVLRRHRLHDVVVSSFDRPRVLQMRRRGLHIRTALLGRPGVPLGVVLGRAAQDGHVEAHPHVTSLLGRLELVRPAAQQGIAVTGWTVNRLYDLTRLADAGVQAAICDDPRNARAALLGSDALASAV
ncbi:MAG: glycerophosphoryl diester phosphodiesterase [Frankiales bacterium]|nr:glycerophosphoryl diester phosphodiesterase [Frankiales bacterium]